MINGLYEFGLELYGTIARFGLFCNQQHPGGEQDANRKHWLRLTWQIFKGYAHNCASLLK